MFSPCFSNRGLSAVVSFLFALLIKLIERNKAYSISTMPTAMSLVWLITQWIEAPPGGCFQSRQRVICQQLSKSSISILLLMGFWADVCSPSCYKLNHVPKSYSAVMYKQISLHNVILKVQFLRPCVLWGGELLLLACIWPIFSETSLLLHFAAKHPIMI